MAFLKHRQRGRPWLMLGLLLGWAGLAPAERPLPEYQVKAAFLYNFAVLTEWPASSFADPQAPLLIGVLGENPFGPLLEQTVAGKQVGKHPLRVVRYPSVAEVGPCHLLFVSEQLVPRLPELLDKLADRPVLLVGDVEGFARSGGMLQMTRRADNTIGLRVNLAAVSKAGLKLSSKLLRLTTIVRGPVPEGDR